MTDVDFIAVHLWRKLRPAEQSTNHQWHLFPPPPPPSSTTTSTPTTTTATTTTRPRRRRRRRPPPPPPPPPPPLLHPVPSVPTFPYTSLISWMSES